LLYSVFFLCPQFSETDYTVVNTDQVEAMIDQKAAFILIDSRTVQEYQEAHIIGAINIPPRKTRKNTSVFFLPTKMPGW